MQFFSPILLTLVLESPEPFGRGRAKEALANRPASSKSLKDPVNLTLIAQRMILMRVFSQ
jgi:hypothetical protein